jgi:hypothetical protein
MNFSRSAELLNSNTHLLPPYQKVYVCLMAPVNRLLLNMLVSFTNNVLESAWKQLLGMVLRIQMSQKDCRGFSVIFLMAPGLPKVIKKHVLDKYLGYGLLGLQ